MRQDQETPTLDVVAAEHHDEVSVAGSLPEKALGEIRRKQGGVGQNSSLALSELALSPFVARPA